MISNYENKIPKPFARTRETQKYDMSDRLNFHFMDAFKQRYPRELKRLQLAMRSYLASSASNTNERELLNEYNEALQSCVQLNRLSNLIPECVTSDLYQHAEMLPTLMTSSADSNSREFVIPSHLVQTLKDKVECLDKAIIAGPGVASHHANTNLCHFLNHHWDTWKKAPPGDIRHLCAKGYIMMGLYGVLTFAQTSQQSGSTSREAMDILR